MFDHSSSVNYSVPYLHLFFQFFVSWSLYVIIKDKASVCFVLHLALSHVSCFFSVRSILLHHYKERKEWMDVLGALLHLLVLYFTLYHILLCLFSPSMCTYSQTQRYGSHSPSSSGSNRVTCQPPSLTPPSSTPSSLTSEGCHSDRGPLTRQILYYQWCFPIALYFITEAEVQSPYLLYTCLVH